MQFTYFCHVKTDEIYMQECLDLARKGQARTAPNPMVGCVIVHDKKVIGRGYHKKYGSNHAEINAINNVKNKNLLKDSTLYVNLEPCCHFGKTPPCIDAIINNKIKKVYIGCLDPCRLVNGKGINRMKEEGINVFTGILQDKSYQLNKRFFTFHTKKRPYIILKWAESLDGFIAPDKQTKPFWMTNILSKKMVHQWRSEEAGILIGRKTAEQDNPLLTVREIKGKNPIRFVIDKKLMLSQNLSLFNTGDTTFVFTENSISENHLSVNFKKLAQSITDVLYQKGIQSIIIEGGAKTLQTFIDAKLWDEARVFTTPIKLKDGIKSPEFNYQPKKVENIDDNQLKTYYL